MNTYYCHQCAKQEGLIEDPPTGKKVSSQYQYDKHKKHTQVDSNYPLQSIFSDPSTSVYADYMVNTIVEGAVEIDDLGRKNLIWCAGKHTGFRVEAGNIVRPTDAVKVVLSSASSSVHAFPENSTSFNAAKCAKCGEPVVFYKDTVEPYHAPDRREKALRLPVMATLALEKDHKYVEQKSAMDPTSNDYISSQWL